MEQATIWTIRISGYRYWSQYIFFSTLRQIFFGLTLLFAKTFFSRFPKHKRSFTHFLYFLLCCLSFFPPVVVKEKKGRCPTNLFFDRVHRRKKSMKESWNKVWHFFPSTSSWMRRVKRLYFFYFFGCTAERNEKC